MTTVSSPDIASNVRAVADRIATACARAGRTPDSVQLVAAAKTQPLEALLAALDAGISQFGHNYVQEAETAVTALRERGIQPTWRLIGHLQTNKINRALTLFDAIDTVDCTDLARAIDQRASRPVRVLLEVNLAEEPSKTGCLPAALPALVDATNALPHLQLDGLMTIAPLTDDPASLAPLFARLRELAARWGLRELSMGMTDDFEVAIAEGSTMVRMGRALFGDRP